MIRFPEGLARDILLKIQDNYVLADFIIILDMGDNEEVPPHSWKVVPPHYKYIIYMGAGQIHFQFSGWKVKCAFNGYEANKQVKVNQPKRRPHSSHWRNEPPAAKICFQIKDKKERFSFISCKLQSPNMSHVQPPI